MIPDLTTLWVVFFLLLSMMVLNALVFKPILQVIDARSAAVRDARGLAESAAQTATSAATEYTQKLNTARGEVYRQMDDMRRTALDKRAAMLIATHATAEAEISAASQRVRLESTDARAALDRDASTLAGAIVARVLGRAS